PLVALHGLQANPVEGNDIGHATIALPVEDAAPDGGIYADDASAQRRLAAAGLAHKPCRFASPGVEDSVTEDLQRDGRAAEVLGQSAHADDRIVGHGGHASCSGLTSKRVIRGTAASSCFV